MAFSSGPRDGKKVDQNLVLFDITHLARDLFQFSDFPVGMQPG